MKRKELVKLLELVQPALKAGLVPVFGCFIFTKNAITAFNGDALAIKADFPNEHVFAVDGKTFLSWLQNSSAETVGMIVDTKEVNIGTGKSTFKLPFLSEDEFLFEEPDEVWDAAIELSDNLMKGLEICLTTTCRDQSMPAIMGVCINFDTKYPTLFSCDGDAITSVTKPDTKYRGKGIYTAPNSFCDALLKIWHETEAVKGKLEINCEWAKAALNTGFTIYGRIIWNEKPLNHTKLIDDTMTGDTQFVPVPEGFSDALARARVLADEECKPTILTVYNGKLDMLTESSFGEAADELSLKGHDDVEAFVFPQLVQRAIGVCNQISIRENCTAYRLDDTVLQVVSNVGE